MVTKAELVKKIKAYIPDVDTELLGTACDFSKKAHGTQKRASGDPYYHHPLEVAEILADMKLDVDTIITALLHDTVEDTSVSLQEIGDKFGKNVKALVDGVTKLAKIEFQSEHTRQAENFRKLLVAMSEDIRVLLVKLADRLHNMRTLHYVKSPDKRLRIAHETMEIYAPLAERIGMQKMKNELQELAFAQLHPEVKDSIQSRLEYLRSKGNMIVDHILGEIRKKIQESAPDLKVEIFGREKTPCSIWQKMEHKNISFEQLSDIMAFRAITENIGDCYRVLGIIHTHYQMIPDSFKDFISTPKDNGYQSLHTIVMGPEQRAVEMQIRTREMHEVAEFGVAAHWSYKQERTYNTDGKQYKWVRELLYILEHASDSDEFLENTKLEMYYDQVFCFTPMGDLVALPRGSTPVDFAYEVHSSVGNHCAGAKVNGRIVPLRTKLKNGDQVDIITSETQVPSAAWDKFIVTGKAKSAVRRFVRAQKREEYLKLGRAMLYRTLREESIRVTHHSFKPAFTRLGKKTLGDIYEAVGEGRLTTTDVLRAIFPNKKFDKKRMRNPLSLLRFNRDRRKESASVPIKGLQAGMAFYFAECCHPIPGDTIVGVVTTGKGMTIHTSDCEMLESFANSPERLIDVSWEKDSSIQTYVGRIKVTLSHEAGSLAALANAIAKGGGNISNLKITNRSTDFFEVLVDVAVRGERQLSNIIKALRTQSQIQAVVRHKR